MVTVVAFPTGMAVGTAVTWIDGAVGSTGVVPAWGVLVASLVGWAGGVPLATLKVAVLDVPPEVVTDTAWVPRVALLAMTNVAVIVVLLTTVTPDVPMPEPLTLMVAPAAKPLPVRVTAVFDGAFPAD